jgi:hypothetical protein
MMGVGESDMRMAIEIQVEAAVAEAEEKEKRVYEKEVEAQAGTKQEGQKDGTHEVKADGEVEYRAELESDDAVPEEKAVIESRNNLDDNLDSSDEIDGDDGDGKPADNNLLGLDYGSSSDDDGEDNAPAAANETGARNNSSVDSEVGSDADGIESGSTEEESKESDDNHAKESWEDGSKDKISLSDELAADIQPNIVSAPVENEGTIIEDDNQNQPSNGDNDDTLQKTWDLNAAAEATEENGQDQEGPDAYDEDETQLEIEYEYDELCSNPDVAPMEDIVEYDTDSITVPITSGARASPKRTTPSKSENSLKATSHIEKRISRDSLRRRATLATAEAVAAENTRSGLGLTTLPATPVSLSKKKGALRRSARNSMPTIILKGSEKETTQPEIAADDGREEAVDSYAVTEDTEATKDASGKSPTDLEAAPEEDGHGTVS